MNLTKKEALIACIGVRGWLDELENIQRYTGYYLTKEGKKQIKKAIDNGYNLLIKLEKESYE